MKRIYKHILASMAVVAGAAGFQSCDLDLSNPDSFDAGNFWQTQAQFEGNLVALMNQWRTNYDTNTLQASELRTDYYWPIQGIDGSGLRNLYITLNQIDYTQPQFSNYGQLYGMISNCNTFLYYDKMRGENVMSADCRNYLLGMIYGMRAWCFFQIHKYWGTGPLRIEADVVAGNYNEVELQMPQASVTDFVNQIKSDIDTSLRYFEAAGNYTYPFATLKYYFWTKAATEMLAGEYYLWTGKVSTADFKAQPANVSTAKNYFTNVINNYGFALCPTFNDAINGPKASNTEVIFASYYSVTEANTNWFNYITYDPTTGGSPNNYWQAVEQDGTTWSNNLQRLTYYTDPLTGVKSRNAFYLTRMTGQQHQQVRNAYYYQFDREDSRIYQLQPVYQFTEEERALIDEYGTNDPRAPQYVLNFNPEDYILAACYVWKYHGQLNTSGSQMIGTNDMVYYRLPQALLGLAECENYLGNSPAVATLVNQVRARAYGENWDEQKFGYKAGSFVENEVAILQEKTKEYFQEGQRWWDLRRMTITPNGTDKDHLIFQPEGCIGYGLDAKLAEHPTWGEIRPTDNPFVPIETMEPVLDYATQMHLVLWPLNKDLMESDPSLKQTWGFTYPAETNREQPWIQN